MKLCSVKLTRLALATVLTAGLLLAPVAAEQVYIRNKPFKGTTSGRGAATMVELAPLAQAMGLTARPSPAGGWCVSFASDGPMPGEELATAGKVVVEGKEVPAEVQGEVVLVNLKSFSEAVGARFQVNSGMDTIDVNVPAKSAASGDWSTGPAPSQGSTVAAGSTTPARGAGLAPIRVKQKTPGERFDAGPWMQPNRINVVYFTAPW